MCCFLGSSKRKKKELRRSHANTQGWDVGETGKGEMPVCGNAVDPILYTRKLMASPEAVVEACVGPLIV